MSSPSPAGQNITLAAANNASRYLVESNRELQWSELYYRGYYELHVSEAKMDARYFGLPTLTKRESGEISLANFTVLAGGNKLERFNGAPAVAGTVANGYLRGGKTVQTNVTNDTTTGTYKVNTEKTFQYS